jgi:hypothetical protein
MALAHRRGDYRGAEEFGEIAQLGARSGGQHPAAGEDHRPPGVDEQLRRTLDLRRVAFDPPARPPFAGCGERDVDRVGLDVHRQIDDDRARPPLEHDVERPLHGAGELNDLGHLPVPLREWGERLDRVGGVQPFHFL